MIIVVLPILLGACDLNYDSSHRLKCNVYSMDDIIKKNNVFLINAVINNQGEHKRFIIDYDTNFDQSCEKQYLGNYEDGETVMDWYKKIMIFTKSMIQITI